jgi:response regulator of citrate/malate metabolism
MSVDKIAESIRVELSQIEQQLAGYHALREKQKRLEKALTALQARSRSTAARPGRNTNVWIPSAKTIDETMALLISQDEPISITALSQQTKISRDTLRRAVETLRERGHARITGMTRGGGKLYAAMPEQKAGGGKLNGRA